MALSLYDVTVPSFLQVLNSVAGYLDKGLSFCSEQKIEPAELVASRLHPDMLPFSFQILSVAHHSLGAIEGAKQGLFQPPARLDLDYAGLQKHIADTIIRVQEVKPDDVNALQGRDMVFKVADRTMPFTCENFLLSFSLPNFYFHATTGYDILRMKGVPLGKRNYLGQLRLKT